MTETVRVHSSTGSTQAVDLRQSEGRPTEQILADLIRFGFDVHISTGGDLWLRTWQLAAKGFLTPQEAEEYRKAHPQPELTELEWVSRNLEQLRRDYSDQHVAILGNRVIASHARLDELLSELRRIGARDSFLTFVPREDVVWDFTF